MERFTLPFEEPIREIEKQIDALLAAPARSEAERQQAIKDLEARKAEKINKIFSNLSAWDRVRIARHPSRPTSADR